MNAVLRQPINRAQKAMPSAVPSPVGGWNTRDSLDAMEVGDAVALDNWFPGLGSCVTRNGSAGYATGLGGSVRTVAEFNALSARKFIAGANARIWDISTAGAGVQLATGFASSDWQWAQFDDASGGPRMGLVNGVDAPQIYNGTAIAAMTVSGTGLAVASLNGIYVYKGRSYFWDDRTQDFWYSATNALGGVLTRFPLGRVQGTGGNMLAMGALSMDSGEGPQDYAVFVLSSGDVLLYAGSDPGSASDWQIRGRYNMGAPISKRAIEKVGAELMIVTKAGYLPLSSVLRAGRLNEQQASGKIRGAALDATAQFGSLSGWDLLHYPRKNQLIVNVPTASGFSQHVMNTETGAWCRFTGIASQCWGLYNDLAYFGRSDGTVHLYDTGFDDAGTPIQADGQTAWNYLGDRRALKRATGIRTLLRISGGQSAYAVGVGFDFERITLGAQKIIASPAGSATFGSAIFGTATFAGDSQTVSRWNSAKGLGYALSSRLAVTSSAQRIEWLSDTYLVERGGVL